jgi:AcrR family transcriptional regulator
MAVRLNRAERKERTRTDLLRAARRVFLRHGFHGASLDGIADEAGYTKGAVYSSFESKDALFLAVLAAHYDRRIEEYSKIIVDGESLDEVFHTVSRFMAEADTREPEWLPLLGEFIAHASRQRALKKQYVRTRERFLEAVADIISGLCSRFGVSLRVSPLDVARGSSVLARGMSAERQLDPRALPPELFVELHTAYLHGLTVPAERSEM